MRIDKVSFRNIASYGNELQVIEFDENQSSFYLITGGNGFGKSTIANAIVYGLYGRVEGVNLSELPNRTNNNLYVKVELTCGTKKVIIERGLKPKKFAVSIDNVEYDQAGKTNVQEYLEQEVFKIPYHVFKNIIIISINEFKSFISMTNKDKRNIIDRLFGFSILNDMLKVIKDDRKNLKEDIKTVDDELKLLTENIMSVNQKLEQLEQISANKNKDNIKSLKDNLIDLNKKKIRLSKVKSKLDTLSTEISDKLDTHKDLFKEKQDLLDTATKNVELRKAKKCPLCESSLTTKNQLEILDENQRTVDEIPTELSLIKLDIEKCKNAIYDNRVNQDKILSQASKLSQQIDNYKNELINIAKNLKTDDNIQFDGFKKLINEFKENEDEKSKILVAKNESDYFLNIMETILGEDGVKNLALNTILPALNTSIASLTSEMHLPFQLRFDDKFDCIITSLGREVSAGTLSTGEKKKADFVIIISIIKMLKLRFPQLNLLFLDEIFSSIDPDGVHSILSILNKVIKENNINAFVINHTVLPAELFDKRMDIFRENGFSKFNIETIS